MNSSARQNEDEVCQVCFGTGTRIEPGKGATICDCRRSNTGARPLDAARIPLRFRGCTLQSYETRNDSQRNALQLAFSLVEHYPAVDKGLLLTGGVGVGKTHLAVAILRDLIMRKGINCLFYESGSLLKAIQDSYNPVSQTSEMRVLAPVYQAEILALDELGATVPTSWVRDTLYQIINTRYNNKKLTIFTTNYPDEARVSTESEEGDVTQRRSFAVSRIRELTTLEERIGTPLRSRLYEMCKKVLIEGEDYRKRADQRRVDAAKG